MNAEYAQYWSDISQPDYIERVRAALKAKKMSQARFACICGCSPSNVSGYLNRYVWPVFPLYMWRAARDVLDVHYVQEPTP